MEISRLQLECLEMTSTELFRRFTLFENTQYSINNPVRFFWKGQMPSGHEVTAKYTSGYPRHPMKVFVSPQVSTHHRWPDGSLCLMKNFEWRPDNTVATVIGILARFLDEHTKGMTG